MFKQSLATLGLLVFMGMSMPSAAVAAEYSIYDTKDKLEKFTTTARERCGGETCSSATFLQTFIGEAERQGLLGSMSKEDYGKLLQDRYPVLTTSQVAIKAIEDLAITGLVLPDARALGYTAPPPMAPAAATQPSAPPTVRPAEAMATKAAVDSLQTQLTAIQGELATLKAKPESSLTDDDRQKLTALPGQIQSVQRQMVAAQAAATAAATSAQEAAASATSASGSAAAAKTNADTSASNQKAAEDAANRANATVSAVEKIVASLSGVWRWIYGNLALSILTLVGMLLLWWKKPSQKQLKALETRVGTVEDWVSETNDQMGGNLLMKFPQGLEHTLEHLIEDKSVEFPFHVEGRRSSDIADFRLKFTKLKGGLVKVEGIPGQTQPMKIGGITSKLKGNFRRCREENLLLGV